MFLLLLIVGLTVSTGAFTQHAAMLCEANENVRIPALRRPVNDPTELRRWRIAGGLSLVVAGIAAGLVGGVSPAWVAVAAVAVQIPGLALVSAHNRRIARGGLTVLR